MLNLPFSTHVIIMLGVDWLSRAGGIPSGWLSPKMLPIRWSVYALAVVMILKNLQNGSSFIISNSDEAGSKTINTVCAFFGLFSRRGLVYCF